jgi:hypothetical protein
MTKNRIIGALAALSLLAVPAVAAAHGNGHHHGRHHHKHHAKKARDVTGAATGTVASFTDGALTITLPNGRSFTADVTNRTILECRTAAPAAATTARHGGDDGDDNRGPGKHGDDDHGSSTAPASTTVPPSTTVPAPTSDDGPNHDAGDDHGHGVRCGTEALVAGAKVTEAKLSLNGGDATWKKVELLK